MCPPHAPGPQDWSSHAAGPCAWGLVSVMDRYKMLGGLRGKVSNMELSNTIQVYIKRKPLCI